MKMAVLVLSLVFAITPALALDFDPFEGPKPIAILIQTDPWLMVIGSDTPRVAIYDDGQVIYLKRETNKSPVYLHKQLSPDEIKLIKAKLAEFGDYSSLRPTYNLAPHITDWPETKIYLSLADTELATSVYGLTALGDSLHGNSSLGGQRESDYFPWIIKELHSYLASLEFADAKPWMPKYVEVMLWGYDHASDKSILWPKESEQFQHSFLISFDPRG